MKTAAENINDILVKTIDKYGDEMVAYVIFLLRSENKVASGRLLKSFNYRVIEDISGYLTQLELLSDVDYAEFVDKGRRPGKRPPTSAIEKWIRQRGIKGRDKKGRFIKNKTLAFLISRKIGKFGIKPTNFISKTMSHIERNLMFDLNNLYGLDNVIPQQDIEIKVKV